MATMNFSHNWNNKLDCDVFTTIRKYDSKKWDYYNKLDGEHFDIILKDKPHCTARLWDLNAMVFKYIPMETVQMDVGYTDYRKVLDIFGKFGIKQNTRCILFTFQKVKE